MSDNSLERRVAALEQEVANLKQSTGKGSRVKNWRRTVGMFEGDTMMEEIDKLTLKIREDERKKASSRHPKRKPIKA